MRVGIVGGTGREGQGLAARWARSGHDVYLGSRDPERAAARARAIVQAAGGAISGGSNPWAVSKAEVVVLSVPYAAHETTLRSLIAELLGRVLIDITVPLKPPAVTRVALPAGSAAALEARAIVGPSTPVIAALHHVGSAQLANLDGPIESDVLVCGDDPTAMATALALIGDLGARAFDAGPLENAVALEALTPVLLHLAKRYGHRNPGIRLTGFPESAPSA